MLRHRGCIKIKNAILVPSSRRIHYLRCRSNNHHNCKALAVIVVDTINNSRRRSRARTSIIGYKNKNNPVRWYSDTNKVEARNKSSPTFSLEKRRVKKDKNNAKDMITRLIHEKEALEQEQKETLHLSNSSNNNSNRNSVFDEVELQARRNYVLELQKMLSDSDVNADSSTVFDDGIRIDHACDAIQIDEGERIRTRREKRTKKPRKAEAYTSTAKHRDKVALQNIASVLKRDKKYFNETMSHLFTILKFSSHQSAIVNIVSSPNDDEQTGNDTSGILKEYKQLYNDSIPMFVDLMHTRPSSVFNNGDNIDAVEEFLTSTDTLDSDSNNASSASEQKVQAVMKKLHDVNFASNKTVNELHDRTQYRVELKMLENQMSLSKQDIHNYQELMDALIANLNKNRNQMDSLSQDYPNDTTKMSSSPAENNSPQPQTKDEIGLFTKLINFFSTPTEDQTQSSSLSLTKNKLTNQDNIQTHKKDSKSQLRHQNYNLRTQLKEIQLLHNTAQEAYDELVSDYSQLSFHQPPSSQDQYYESTIQVIDTILTNDICPALAYCISDWYSDVLERYKKLDRQTDLTKPQDWYMYARVHKRKIIFHGGPTNSGKTYSALERLKKSSRGLYLGPLRLLASEIYETLNSEGIPINLITGQEKREVPNAKHCAATVEMAQTDRDYDVAIIDEIQMIGDKLRGYAWTKALLGIRCKEMHVCGGMEALELVQKIAKSCGDYEVEVRTYDRFAPLIVEDESLASHPNEKECYGSNVQSGDCIVAFSQKDLYAIKREIESLTEHKCCIIYGSLPPETRTQQAKLFNDPTSGYDILIASDAIGMGLNLNIRRIIFNSLYKYQGDGITRLDPPSVKQISGRAGRRNSPFPDGLVTCRNPEDLDYLRKCLDIQNEPIVKAGLFPTVKHIEHFSKVFQDKNNNDEWITPSTPTKHKKYDNVSLFDVLQEFSKMATLQENYFLCNQKDMLHIAELIDQIPLSIQDKFKFSLCPVNARDGQPKLALKKFAWKHYIGQTTKLTRTTVPNSANSMDELMNLCSIYNEIDIFLWLCIRFPNSKCGMNKDELENARRKKEKLIELINEGIENNVDWKLNHCYLQRDYNMRKRWMKGRDYKNELASSFMG